MKKAQKYLITTRFHKGRSYRNRISVFLICVVISFLLWGLIKLAKVYEAPVKFKVKFEQLPSNRVMVAAEDSVITLYLKARGHVLYSKILTARKNNLSIDLSNLRLRRDGDKYYGYIRTNRFMQQISEQLTDDAELLGVQPDTLKFVFEAEARHKVPVKPDISLSYAQQFQLYDSLRLQPDSVYIYGIKSIVDTLYIVNTEHKNVKNLKGTREVRVRLLRPETNPKVRLSQDSITISITAERFTEATLEVPVKIENPEQGVSYRTFPDKVTLTCRVAMREYKRMDPSLFVVAINPVEASASGSALAEVRVIKEPPFAKVIRVKPERVEYLIIK